VEAAMTRLLGIFGYPLGHSISPAMHQAALDDLGIDATYEAWATPPEALAGKVALLRRDPYLGANVTVPHKLAVMDMIDSIDPMAESLGAVNTIVRDGARLVGYNTDAYGFIRSLKEVGGFDPAGKRVVLIGAGGAARAAAYGLAMEGAASITIANRTVERATRLATEVAARGIASTGIALDGDEIGPACEQADLIVNSSSIGMWHGPGEDASPIHADLIPTACVVYDMVYNPPVTPLLRDARNRGAAPVGGLSMLVYQGAAAFEKWTGRNAPVDVMFAAAKKALSGMIESAP